MKILYLMHIDWNWIKQRPQFIAEYIEKKSSYKVIVLYKKSFQKKRLVKNECNLTRKPIAMPRLPFARFVIIEKINILIESLFCYIYSRRCHLIYVTHPLFLHSITHIKHKKIIYDCMDDILEFSLPSWTKTRFYKYEKRLIQKSDIVVFSSNYLKNVVENRTSFNFSSIVVNNAIQGPKTDNESHEQKSNSLDSIFCGKQHRIISYIGTISDWFDYDLLVNATNDNTTIQFYIFGPVEHNFIPAENVQFFGPLRHDDVFYIMNKSDALIMPFILTPLIQSVNPVKLYEYIYSGKPVISIRYDEALPFEKYVYLYNAGDIDSLQKILDELKKNNYSAKVPPKEMRDFALNNTWEKRIDSLLPYFI